MPGNDKNKGFYNNVPLDVFQSMTKQGGFAAYKDMKLIEQDIPSHASVLEVGAGDGRCVDFLLARKHQGKIIALEQSPQFCKILLTKYAGNSQVEVLHQDIKDTDQPLEKADIILWLFSGLLDFAKEEQLSVLKRLRNLLNPGGKLFLDIPQFTQLTVAKYTDKQSIVMETAYGNIETFLPGKEDMQQYALDAGFKKVDVTDYETDTGKKRSMYTLCI